MALKRKSSQSSPIKEMVGQSEKKSKTQKDKGKEIESPKVVNTESSKKPLGRRIKHVVKRPPYSVRRKNFKEMCSCTSETEEEEEDDADEVLSNLLWKNKKKKKVEETKRKDTQPVAPSENESQKPVDEANFDKKEQEKVEIPVAGEKVELDSGTVESRTETFLKCFRDSIEIARRTLSAECQRAIDVAHQTMATECEGVFKAMLKELTVQAKGGAKSGEKEKGTEANKDTRANSEDAPNFNETPVLSNALPYLF